ncbi:MAG: monofunctional biosynthetic peptidoglycan transglycosylase [Aeromicrobium sp.]|nr:monofunctional biosynthetic peptidoglycan transglycosylase [Burkholderiales bacterium]
MGKQLAKWLLSALAILLAIFIAFQSYLLAHLIWWRSHNPNMTAFMESRLSAARQVKPTAKLVFAWVSYSRISDNLKRAVLTSEDDKFVDHDGFDWEGIQKALEKNERRGKVVAGGSTISQQLAKNLFLSSERSFFRKAQEALITIMMEGVMEKERILEIYLNVIEWGDGVFGAEAAARHYFGVSAAQLSASQAARLAAMVPRPRFYDKNRNSPYLAKRAESIEKRMHLAQLP